MTKVVGVAVLAARSLGGVSVAFFLPSNITKPPTPSSATQVTSKIDFSMLGENNIGMGGAGAASPIRRILVRDS